MTTLVLNAGMGAFLGLDWYAAARQFFTDPVGCVSEPDYIMQEKGKMSADGERGGVWGVNVLSTYILVCILHDLAGDQLMKSLCSPRNSMTISAKHQKTSR